jgi:glycosyltransferase involved in cell wall biosynthesis
VLLRAFAMVLRSHASARLLCAGDGDFESVDKVIASLGISDSVEVLGWIDECARSEILRTASMFVLPSFAEGLPMGIIEAMSAGIPVVATPVGGVPEIISDGVEGILVPVADEKALSRAIEKIIEDVDLRTEMGKQAKAKFESSFSADVIIPQLESLYVEFGLSPRAGAK